MRYKTNLFACVMAVMLLLPVVAQAGATFSSTYAVSAGVADVSITNTGTEALYDVSLLPVGPGADAAAPIYIGTLDAGVSTNIQINMATDMGYVALNGSGADINGQSVQISIVSQGR